MITHSNPHALSHKRHYLQWIKIVILPKNTKQFPEYMWQTNSFEDPLSLTLIESTIISTISWYHKKSARGHKENRWELRKEKEIKEPKEIKKRRWRRNINDASGFHHHHHPSRHSVPAAVLLIIITETYGSQPLFANVYKWPYRTLALDAARLHLVRHFFLKSFSMHHRTEQMQFLRARKPNNFAYQARCII